MTSLTPQEISTADEPMSRVSGTAATRLNVHVRVGAGANTGGGGIDLINLGVVPAGSVIEGVIYETDGGSPTTTTTLSGGTATTTTVGQIDLGLVVRVRG